MECAAANCSVFGVNLSPFMYPLVKYVLAERKKEMLSLKVLSRGAQNWDVCCRKLFILVTGQHERQRKSSVVFRCCLFLRSLVVNMSILDGVSFVSPASLR